MSLQWPLSDRVVHRFEFPFLEFQGLEVSVVVVFPHLPPLDAVLQLCNMTHNDCICHTLNTVFCMLGSFSPGNVFLFFHSNHNSCFSLSVLCVLVFWEVAVVSLIFFFHPTCLV